MQTETAWEHRRSGADHVRALTDPTAVLLHTERRLCALTDEHPAPLPLVTY